MNIIDMGNMPAALTTNWRIERSGKHLSGKMKRADKRGRRALHRAGPVHALHIPDYGSGDALTDAVQASIARDLLLTMASIGV